VTTNKSLSPQGDEPSGLLRLGFAALAFLLAVAFLVATLAESASADHAVGFLMTGAGGIGLAVGEWIGGQFGSREQHSPVAPLIRCEGFVALTLGALLLAFPDAVAAKAGNEFVGNLYAFVAVAALFACIAWLALALDPGRDGVENPGHHEQDEYNHEDRVASHQPVPDCAAASERRHPESEKQNGHAGLKCSKSREVISGDSP
jgi:hypothetical protein